MRDPIGSPAKALVKLRYPARHNCVIRLLAPIPLHPLSTCQRLAQNPHNGFHQPPRLSQLLDMATTVSAEFIESLCDKLKASLDLNANLRTGARRASLDRQMFNMVSGSSSEQKVPFSNWMIDQIMDAHISTLTCHTTILEQLLETAVADQQEPALSELKRAVDRARDVLGDAHIAKDLITGAKTPPHSRKVLVGQTKKMEKSKSDQKASSGHDAEADRQSAADGEDEKFFYASEERDCDPPESPQKQDTTNDTNLEATPKLKRRLSASDQRPTPTTSKRRKHIPEASEQSQKRKRDRLSTDSATLHLTDPKKSKPNLPEYERRYLTDEEYEALYPSSQPEVPTEDLTEDVEHRRDNGQIEKRKIDEDEELEQRVEEAGMVVGKKRRVGNDEQWAGSFAGAQKSEPSLGVGDRKDGENGVEASGIGGGVKRGGKGWKSDGEHLLKRAKTVHGRV